MMQQGKGANMGAAFGSGSSNTLFGSRGPASFMMRITATLVTLFFITSISLGYIAAKREKSSSKLNIAVPTQVKKATKTVVPKTLPVKKQTKSSNSTVPVLGTTKAPTKKPVTTK